MGDRAESMPSSPEILFVPPSRRSRRLLPDAPMGTIDEDVAMTTDRRINLADDDDEWEDMPEEYYQN